MMLNAFFFLLFLNPSNAEAAFVQNIKAQKKLKNI